MREDRGYFCLPEIDMGMPLTYRMNALVCGKLSGNTLRDVLQTGLRLSGPDALARGIVDRVAPVDSLRELGLELAQPMCAKSREALSGLKRGINHDILAVIESDEPEVIIGRE
jgi:enoyl-CoA hydratase/carnithine racemase